jgi:hypothetical protein
VVVAKRKAVLTVVAVELALVAVVFPVVAVVAAVDMALQVL